MKNIKSTLIPLTIFVLFTSHAIGQEGRAPVATPDQRPANPPTAERADDAEMPDQIIADRFADIQVLRYGVPGWSTLTPKQKELAYYFYKAGLSGRDIFYDQKYKYNLMIRKTLECILTEYKGDRQSKDWGLFETYCKQFFFANGIHHHYSSDKFVPACRQEYFDELVKGCNAKNLPLDGKNVDAFLKFIKPIIFQAKLDAKCVNLSPDVDNVKASAVNYYEGVTKAEVESFYKDKGTDGDLPSYGLNSKMVKENGRIIEKQWKSGGIRSKYRTAMARRASPDELPVR